MELLVGDESFAFDYATGGGRGEALTLRRIRHAEDAADILHLMDAEEPIEVVIQPLDALGRPTGSALIYQGLMRVIKPDYLDANSYDVAYLTVSLDEWDVRRREHPNG